jgi:UDP-glucuronate 4-epimerase
MQDYKNKKIFITGVAGFIGFHLAKKLTEIGFTVIGIDNLNDYYDINLKYARLKELGIISNDNEKFISKDKSFIFFKINLSEKNKIVEIFNHNDFISIIHLAAQAGVRYSIEFPDKYIESNINGFFNILEVAKQFKIKNLLYASSSSVYGNNSKMPFTETEDASFPESLYAATKKSNELMACSYSKLYNFNTIGLRFFTVYGPWGRPDMSPFLFTNAILSNKKINLFNNGIMERDFTYIDDIVEGIVSLHDYYLKIECEVENKFEIYNIGNGNSVKILDFINEIEKNLNLKAEFNYLPMQKGDVYKTYASTDKLKLITKYNPKTNIEIGVRDFIIWFKNFYKI